MNKDAVNNYAGSSRERTGEGSLSLLRASSDAVRFTTTSNFVLQWGNRKRLRCMKRVQANADSPGPVQRTGSRVFRSDEDKEGSNNNTINHTHTNNFPQRPSSPQQLRRIRTEKRSSESLEVRSLPSPLRSVFSIDFQTNPWNWENSSSAMRGMSNGLKGMALPDKLGAHENRSCNVNNRNHHQDSENNKPAAASDTAHDSKKGGYPSGSGDAISQVWPPKFVISLTNKEKEEDFLALKGSKLPQRPKKRAKFIQRTLNLVSPGAFLCDLTLERYEVREKKMTKKRPRGLKAMGNMESDSE